MPAQVTRITLDIERALFFNTSSLMDAEQVMGKTVRQATGGDLGTRDLVVLLWAGLRHREPKLEIPKVARMLDKAVQAPGRSHLDVWIDVIKALRRSGVLPERDEPEPGDDENPTPSPDAGSTPA